MSKNANAFIVSLMLYKIKSIFSYLLIASLLACLPAAVFAGKVSAAPCDGLTGANLVRCRQDQNTAGPPSGPEGSSAQTTEQPKSVKSDCKGSDLKAGEPEGSENHCAILDYLVIVINVLSAIVGIVIVIMIIIGGIQYSSSGDNPQAISGAKNRIFNAVIALAIYIFSYSFLQWIVPGGVLP